MPRTTTVPGNVGLALLGDRRATASQRLSSAASLPSGDPCVGGGPLCRLRSALQDAGDDVVAGRLDRGATMVGGCCGMEPLHIAALAELVESRE